MVSKINKNAMRVKRHIRVRGKISGTPECPRLNVFRSNANIYAQIIDDVNGVTLASANTLEKSFEGAAGNCEAAKKVGDLKPGDDIVITGGMTNGMSGNTNLIKVATIQ